LDLGDGGKSKKVKGPDCQIKGGEKVFCDLLTTLKKKKNKNHRLKAASDEKPRVALAREKKWSKT